MSRHALVLAGLAGAVTACAAIANFDALHPVDAPLDGGDAQTSSSDGAPSDGSQGDVARPSPCATDAAHAFCDDFDRGTIDVPTKWSTVLGPTVTDAAAASLPFSVRMTPSAVSDGGTRMALEIAFNDPPRGLRVQLDVLLRNAVADGFLFAEAEFSDGGLGYYASSRWYTDNSGTVLDVSWPPSGFSSTARAHPSGVWQHLDVYYTFSADGGAAPCGFDASNSIPITSSAVPPPSKMTLGLFATETSTNVLPDVYVDNVVLDVEQ